VQVSEQIFNLKSDSSSSPIRLPPHTHTHCNRDRGYGIVLINHDNSNYKAVAKFAVQKIQCKFVYWILINYFCSRGGLVIY